MITWEIYPDPPAIPSGTAPVFGGAAVCHQRKDPYNCRQCGRVEPTALAQQLITAHKFCPVKSSPQRRRAGFDVTATNSACEPPADSRRATHGDVMIGAVSYLNSKPLIEGLGESRAGRLVLDVPSRLADSLALGQLDVALIPSIEVIRSRGSYEIVSDACVAARGPVFSVKAYFRVPPGSVRTLALDEGSRTSAALLLVLLSHKYGCEPATKSFPLGTQFEETKADAVLVIGDRAMATPEGDFAAVWDLGEQWHDWTGLPFVFAAWAARSGCATDEVAAILTAARDRGRKNVRAIAEREGRAMRLATDFVVEYLTENLHFTLGPAEQSALKLFAQLAADLDLGPRGNSIVFHEPADKSQPRANGRRVGSSSTEPRDRRHLANSR